MLQGAVVQPPAEHLGVCSRAYLTPVVKRRASGVLLARLGTGALVWLPILGTHKKGLYRGREGVWGKRIGGACNQWG